MKTAVSAISFLLFTSYFWGLCPAPGKIHAQSHRGVFQHLNSENGLTDNFVNCIIQDAEGIIWIGTQYGLNQFDGYTCTAIFPDGDSLEATNRKSIYSAFKDSKDRLWFCTTGLLLYFPQSRTFRNFRHEPGSKSSLAHDDVFKVVEDEHNNIWVGTRMGLQLFDESTGSFVHFMHDTTGTPSEIHGRNRIIDMVADQHGNLWMTTLLGLYQFSLDQRMFYYYPLDPTNTLSFVSNASKYLCRVRPGILWVQYENKGLYEFDTYHKCYTPVEVKDKEISKASLRIHSLYCDSKDQIWIATAFDGLLCYESRKSLWHHFKKDIFEKTSIADNKTTTVFEDQSGMIWIGTFNRGVDRLSRYPSKFNGYVRQPGKLHTLCEDDISYAVEDHFGNLWIGSKNGLIYFDRGKNQFTCHKHIDDNLNSLSDNCIYSIAVDSLNHIWVGTDNGLNYFQPTLKKWTVYHYYENRTNSLPGRIVFDICIQKNGNVCLATNNRICQFVNKTNTFETRYTKSQFEKLPVGYYVTIFEDRRNGMWLSTTRSGIVYTDSEFNIIKTYRRSGGFSASMVHAFREDTRGVVWMASDRGLYYKLSDTDDLLALKTPNKSLNSDIKAIELENDSTIWAATPEGLIRIQIDHQFKIVSEKMFTDKDGLLSKSINNCASLKLRSGELFFGSVHGFNLFNPSTIRYNSYIPPVILTKFKILQKEVSIYENIATSKVLELKDYENYFSFEMATLNYDQPGNNQYAYQLIGHDPEMIYSGTNRTVYYNNIRPGKYTLKVMGSNNDGIWNENGVVLPIRIHAPLLMRPWFQILIFCAILLLVWFVYNYRIRSIQKNAQMNAAIEQKITEARLTALRAQMNPHFIFNTLNAISQLISESDKLNAHNYLNKFSKLIRMVLQNSNKNMSTVDSELKMIELYLELESMRFSHNFSYSIILGSNPEIPTTEIPAMLLHPFVENAIIHGLLHKKEKGQLKIFIDKDETQLICIIEDNGIGRQASRQLYSKRTSAHHSFGLKMTHERLDMIAFATRKKAEIEILDLTDEQGKGIGTKVVIEIPLDIQI